MTHGKDWMVGASTCSVGKATPEVVRAYAEAGLDAMEISLKAHEYAALDLPLAGQLVPLVDEVIVRNVQRLHSAAHGV